VRAARQLHVCVSPPPLAYFALIRPFATQRSSNKWGSLSLAFCVCAFSSSAADSLCNCVVSFCVPAAARPPQRTHNIAFSAGFSAECQSGSFFLDARALFNWESDKQFCETRSRDVICVCFK
jgi:hypothetical protein